MEDWWKKEIIKWKNETLIKAWNDGSMQGCDDMILEWWNNKMIKVQNIE